MVWPRDGFLTALVAGLAACSNAGLQPIGGAPEVVDNALAIEGQFCVSPPDEVAFPIKLLIVIDQSASLQCTDPGNARLAALNAVGQQLDDEPNVEFAVIGFASWSRITEFTSDWSEAAAALRPDNGQGGPATDYQGSLATAVRVLEEDMVRSGPALVARSRYLVVFLSDGVPEPRCRAGCNDGDTVPDSLYGVCNTSVEIPDTEYVDMRSPCPDYNQEPQILQRVQDLVDLGDVYGAGEIAVHSLLLFAPPEDVAAVCGDVSGFGYVRDEAEPLLRAIATAGGGTFRDVNTSQEIDFLDFGYESLEAPFVVSELYAANLSTLPTPSGAINDSDNDGLDDVTEFDEGLDRLHRDTDGDGFSDRFEHAWATRGFDPTDPDVPALGCSDPEDRDGDGLSACEEAFLGTDPLQPDTDGDRIHDGMELRLGMDPTVLDTRLDTREKALLCQKAELDTDLDGVPAIEEIRVGTHPARHEPDDLSVERIRWRVDEKPAEGGACYDYRFENVRLSTTVGEGDHKGRNRIYVYAHEAPSGLSGGRGRIHTTCVEARYLGERFKEPASGELGPLHPARFVELGLFDPELHCLEIGDDPSAPPPWAAED